MSSKVMMYPSKQFCNPMPCEPYKKEETSSQLIKRMQAQAKQEIAGFSDSCSSPTIENMYSTLNAYYEEFDMSFSKDVAKPAPAEIEEQDKQDLGPNTAQLVHNPYSFAVYQQYTGFGDCEDGDDENENEGECEAEGEEGEGEGRKRRQRRRKVVPPCGHDQYKRLRFKKGLSHFLCTVCSTKWKQAGV